MSGTPLAAVAVRFAGTLLLNRKPQGAQIRRHSAASGILGKNEVSGSNPEEGSLVVMSGLLSADPGLEQVCLLDET